MTLQQFLDVPNATILNDALAITRRTLGGAGTSNLVILDLERPVQYNDLYLHNDSVLTALVAAIRRRVQIARRVLPNAEVALYDGHAKNNATIIEGYQRAARLGLWDDVDYLIPVLYLPIQPPASSIALSPAEAANFTADLLAATVAGKTSSRGEALPMAPLLSWLYFPWYCAVPYDVTRAVLATLERLSSDYPIPIVHLWSGKDNETSHAVWGKYNRSCPTPPTAQRDWLERARVVPERCLR